MIQRQVLGLSQDSWERLDDDMSIAHPLPVTRDGTPMDIDGEGVKEVVQNGKRQGREITNVSTEQSDDDLNSDSPPGQSNNPRSLSTNLPNKQPGTSPSFDVFEDSRSSSEKSSDAELQEIIQNGNITQQPTLASSIARALGQWNVTPPQTRPNRLISPNGQLRARIATPDAVTQASARLGNVLGPVRPQRSTFASSHFGPMHAPRSVLNSSNTDRISRQQASTDLHTLTGLDRNPGRLQPSPYNSQPAHVQPSRNGSYPYSTDRRDAVRSALQGQLGNAAQSPYSTLFQSTAVPSAIRNDSNSIEAQLDFVQQSLGDGTAHVNTQRAATVSDKDSEPKEYEGYGPNGEFLDDVAEPPVNDNVKHHSTGRVANWLAHGASDASSQAAIPPRSGPTLPTHRTDNRVPSSSPSSSWPYEAPQPFGGAAEIVTPILPDAAKIRYLTWAKRQKWKELSIEKRKVYLDKEWRRYRERMLRNGKEAIDIITELELLGADSKMLDDSVYVASWLTRIVFAKIQKNEELGTNLIHLRDTCQKMWKRQQKLEIPGTEFSSAAFTDEDRFRARCHYICEEGYDWVCKQLEPDAEGDDDATNEDQVVDPDSPEVQEPDRFNDARAIDQEIRRIARNIGGYDATNPIISMLETQKQIRERRKTEGERDFSMRTRAEKQAGRQAREAKKATTAKKQAKAAMRVPSPEDEDDDEDGDEDGDSMAVDHAVPDNDAAPNNSAPSAVKAATQDDQPENDVELPDAAIDSSASSEDAEDESLQFTISVACNGMRDLGYTDDEQRIVSIIKAKSSQGHLAQTIADNEIERVLTNYRYYNDLPSSRVDLHTTSATVGDGEFYSKTVALHVDKQFKANIVMKVTSKSIMTHGIIAAPSTAVAACFEKFSQDVNGDWQFLERSDIHSIRRFQSSVHAGWSAREMMIEWARHVSNWDENVVAGVRARVDEEIDTARVLGRPYEGEALFWEHEETIRYKKMKVWVQRY